MYHRVFDQPGHSPVPLRLYPHLYWSMDVPFHAAGAFAGGDGAGAGAGVVLRHARKHGGMPPSSRASRRWPRSCAEQKMRELEFPAQPWVPHVAFPSLSGPGSAPHRRGKWLGAASSLLTPVWGWAAQGVRVAALDRDSQMDGQMLSWVILVLRALAPVSVQVMATASRLW